MKDTLDSLGVSWPKLIAQTINFAIVLFVLWKWAYRPVLALLEERRQKVAQTLADADKARADLARIEEERRRILGEAGAQSTRLIEDARTAASRILEQETQKAIATANDIVAKARQASEAELARMKLELRREVGRLVVQTTAKVTGKVLTLDDQKRLAEETNQQLAA